MSFDYYCLFLSRVHNGSQGGFGTPQLNKFSLAWDHLTITIIGRLIHSANFYLLALAIGVS